MHGVLFDTSEPICSMLLKFLYRDISLTALFSKQCLTGECLIHSNLDTFHVGSNCATVYSCVNANINACHMHIHVKHFNCHQVSDYFHTVLWILCDDVHCSWALRCPWQHSRHTHARKNTMHQPSRKRGMFCREFSQTIFKICQQLKPCRKSSVHQSWVIIV